MKIDFEKNLVSLSPESADEKEKLEKLWRMLVDCNGDAKKLSPVGEYIPAKNSKPATFFIEDSDAKTAAAAAEVGTITSEDCVVVCTNCNKMIQLKKGSPVPVCCGKMMDIVD